MKQSVRVRIFGVGFLAGCILAAGFAFYRAQDEPPPPLPLPIWEALEPTPPLPEKATDLPPDLKAFRSWKNEDGVIRWIASDPEQSIWRISQNESLIEVVRADRIRVFGFPGIGMDAFEAGLEHNGFEILDFHGGRTEFIVNAAAFEPNGVEEAIRLLESRDLYIERAEPIQFDPESN